jgi:purine-cytosine permease-like protein
MKDFFRRQFHALKTTQHHYVRKTVGILLVVAGLFGFLPMIGYWMIPMGLALLAVDFPLARRLHRRLVVGWERLYRRLRPRANKS